MVDAAVLTARDAIIDLLRKHDGAMAPKALIAEMEAQGFRRTMTQSALQLALSRGDVRVGDDMEFAAPVHEAA